MSHDPETLARLARLDFAQYLVDEAADLTRCADAGMAEVLDSIGRVLGEAKAALAGDGPVDDMDHATDRIIRDAFATGGVQWPVDLAHKRIRRACDTYAHVRPASPFTVAAVIGVDR